MTLRLLILFGVVLLAGCGDTTPTTAPAQQPGAKLPPEAEFDPVTATEKYQKNTKARP